MQCDSSDPDAIRCISNVVSHESNTNWKKSGHMWAKNVNFGRIQLLCEHSLVSFQIMIESAKLEGF